MSLAPSALTSLVVTPLSSVLIYLSLSPLFSLKNDARRLILFKILNIVVIMNEWYTGNLEYAMHAQMYHNEIDLFKSKFK